MNLEIEYYQKDNGKNPVEDYINRLPRATQAKVIRTILLLKEYGTYAGMPYVKSLAGIKNCWELRVSSDKNIYRFGFTICRGRAILVHAFNKKSNKTAQKDLKIIRQRVKEIK